MENNRYYTQFIILASQGLYFYRRRSEYLQACASIAQGIVELANCCGLQGSRRLEAFNKWMKTTQFDSLVSFLWLEAREEASEVIF